MAGAKGRVLKVIKMEGGSTETAHSKQLDDDDFTYGGRGGLQEPPYPPEELVYMAESHHTHDSALQQKTQDVIGAGWEWRAEGDESSEDRRDELEKWFTDLGNDPERDCTMHETLNSAWDDLETVGWGAIEIARDVDGAVRHVYHVPAHTTRFHKDGIRIAQRRGNKTVWFKRWIPDDDRVVSETKGTIAEKGKIDSGNVANEMLVLKRNSRRSTWYGIPSYISSLGWIVLSLAARDDNLHFFNNAREARWAIVLSNLEDDADLDEQLREAFTVDLKQPHRNIIIPIEGPGDIKFQKMTDDGAGRDLSFDKLQARADGAILLSHKMPAERLGLAKAGPLGGDITLSTTRVYKEAVITPSQELLAVRINRFVMAEYPDAPEEQEWEWRAEELDLTEERDDVETTSTAFKSNMMRLNEARERIGLPHLEDVNGNPDPRGDLFFADIAGAMIAKGKTSASLAAVDRQIRELLST